MFGRSLKWEENIMGPTGGEAEATIEPMLSPNTFLTIAETVPTVTQYEPR